MKNILLFLITLNACLESNVPEYIIKTDEAQAQNLLMSDFFESIEYVRLETTHDCLLGGVPIVYLFDDLIVTIDRQCSLFDRSTGKFIRKVGREGKGADEYTTIPRGVIINEQESSIYLHGGNHLLEYSLSDSIAPPKSYYFPHHFLSLGGMAYLSDNLWAVGVLNITGNTPSQLLFCDKEKVIDSIPNYNFFTLKTNSFDINPNENLFYRYRDDVYFKNAYNDTIFKIADGKLQKKWVFDMGNFHLPLELKEDPSTMYKKNQKLLFCSIYY